MQIQMQVQTQIQMQIQMQEWTASVCFGSYLHCIDSVFESLILCCRLLYLKILLSVKRQIHMKNTVQRQRYL